MFVGEQMTGCERVLAAIQGRDFDRLPVINPTSVATVESMVAVQSFFPKAHYDAQGIAVLAAAGHEILGFDTVAPYFSIVLEASALGCDLDWGQVDTMPEIQGIYLKRWSDWSYPKDFLDRRPIKALLKAIELLKKRYGNRVAIVGKVIGPWTLAYHLCGVQNFLLGIIVDPETAKKLLQELVKVSLELAYAELEKGAHLLTWADHATSNLVSAACYREFLLPIHQEAMRQLAKECPVILHTCGKVNDRFSYYTQAGFTAFHFDSRNSLSHLLQTAKNHVTLIGGINNPQLLLNGTSTEIKKSVICLLHMGVNLVAPECAVPIRTPNSNLKEIVKTVREYSRQMRKISL